MPKGPLLIPSRSHFSKWDGQFPFWWLVQLPDGPGPLCLLLSQPLCKKLMSGCLYWSEHGAIWVRTLTLPVAKTQRRAKACNCSFQIAVRGNKDLLTQRAWSCLMAVSGSSSVSFVQLSFELRKLLGWPSVCHLIMWEEPKPMTLFCLEHTTD